MNPMLALLSLAPCPRVTLVAAILPFLFMLAHAGLAQKTRVLIDTDANNELDDQHALAYLLFSGDRFDVEGITVNRTRNGGDIDSQALEAERIVRLAGLSIPVIRGASGSYEEIRPHLGEDRYDGKDAVDLIIEKAHEGPDPLVLLPVGKLTNVALALEKDPSIASHVRIVWLGSNYPEPGEYNQINDLESVNRVLESSAPFEIALVRYGKPTATDAVRATLDEIRTRMPGKGPRVDPPVEGRNGGAFSTFGDYSVDLFEHIELHGNPPSRALFDMAAVAVVKNPSWATAARIPAPTLVDGKWIDRPNNPRTIILWEHFDRDAITGDFYQTMEHPTPAR